MPDMTRPSRTAALATGAVAATAVLLAGVAFAGTADASGRPGGGQPTSTAPPPVKQSPAPGTTVYPSRSTQVMVADRSSGYHGTYTRYQWTGTAWSRVGTSGAQFGINGLKPAFQRVEGDHTSPIGTFDIVYTFGQGNPGTAMSYRTITSCSWWIEKPGESDYNRWRESCSVSGSVAEWSEHLQSYVTNSIGQYRQAAVIGFNYTNPRSSGPGSGSGIFLHYEPSDRATWGCIGLNSYTELVNTLRWMTPGGHPVIVIKS